MAKVNKDDLKIGVTFTSCKECDRVEITHAKWTQIVDFGDGYCFGFCSVCGTEHKAQNATALKMDYRYCRWCGSKID